MRESIIIEIGVEEIPSMYMGNILNQLKELIDKELKAARIEFSGFEITGTARRLIVELKNVVGVQRPLIKEIKGPPLDYAFSKDGKPTEVLKGFIGKHRIGSKDIKVMDTDKGKYIFAVKKTKGERVEKVIPNVIRNVLNSISLPKVMRWGKEGKFIRPLRWILTLYGKKALSFEYMGIKAGKYTYVSRAYRAMRVRVNNVREYRKVLRRNGVIPNHLERRREVEGYLKKLEKKGWKFKVNGEFTDSIIFSVEKPYGFTGRFEPKFLELPPEFIHHVLKEQVRCLAVESKEGKILPYFVGFANVRPTRNVIKGYEKVVTARLEDALFYAEEDLRKSIDQHVDRLKRIVHHEKIGSLYHKTMRLRVLAKFLRPYIMPEVEEDFVDKLVLMSKFDHATSTCQEFPELRGVVGKWLGERYGIEKEICDAIKEQYLPLRIGDKIPSSRAGLLLAVVNRIEEITSLFYIGYRPTGSEDPFGVRRDALALVEILSRRLSLPLREAVSKVVELFDSSSPQLVDDVFQFIKERFKFYMHSKGIPVELIEAVVGRVDDLKEARTRIEAFYDFSRRHPEDAERIVIGRKRISNIMMQAGNPELPSTPISSVLVEDEEKKLYEYYSNKRDDVKNMCDAGGYNELFKEYVRISDILQKFFDKVFVMVKDESLRVNRLALLKIIGNLYDYFADFRKIPTKKFGGG